MKCAKKIFVKKLPNDINILRNLSYNKYVNKFQVFKRYYCRNVIFVVIFEKILHNNIRIKIEGWMMIWAI